MARLVHPLGARVDGVDVLGARGADLARLVSLDLPVAPGFVVSTAAWYGAHLPYAVAAGGLLSAQIDAELSSLERRTGRRLDDPNDPLLLSLIASSTSGDMRDDAVMLDVGLSDVTLPGLVARTERAFAWRAYVDLLRAFCTRVHGLTEAAVDAAVTRAGAAAAAQVQALKCMVAGAGHPWSERARDQVAQAVSSLLKAAPTPTAVVVQARTFGAGTEPSGSGRVFSRDPVGGAIGSFGEFRPGADRLIGSEQRPGLAGMDSLRRHSPEAAAALCSGLASVEVIHHDMCEVEFTLEAGQLFLDDARPGPRTSRAAVQIAVDLVDAGLIDVETALYRISLPVLEDLQPSVVSGDQQLRIFVRGNVAAPGVALGRLLGWAADGSRLPCRASAPATAVVVDLPIDLDGAAAILELAVQALPDLPLWCSLPDQIRGDLRPPRGPWAGVVAPPHLGWAGELLAWRLTRVKLPSPVGSPEGDPGSSE